MPKKIGFKNAYALGQIKYGLDKEGKKSHRSTKCRRTRKTSSITKE